MKRLSMVLLASAVLLIVGCSAGTAGTQGEPSATPAATASAMSDEEMLGQAVEDLYPGFAVVEFLGKEKGLYYVSARHTQSPDFVVKLALMKDNEWEKSTTIGDATWSASNLLNEATEDSALLKGDLQLQVLRTIPYDAELTTDKDGRYITELSVVSNVEIRAFVEEANGEYSSYTYKLDMRQSPHKFVLDQAYDNR